MKVQGIDGPCDIDEAVSAASALYDHNLSLTGELGESGQFLTFSLRVIDKTGPGASVNERTGRRSVSACWHAHRDVLAALFIDFPGARVRTSLESYDGAQDFLAKYPATGYRNVGSIALPGMLSNQCACTQGASLLVQSLRVVVDDLVEAGELINA